MKIQGSVAIVTGGAQGIGEKICTALLDRGCKVRKFIRGILGIRSANWQIYLFASY